MHARSTRQLAAAGALLVLCSSLRAMPPAPRFAPGAAYRFDLDVEFRARAAALWIKRATGLQARVGVDLVPERDGVGLRMAGLAERQGVPSYLYVEGQDDLNMCAALSACTVPADAAVARADARVEVEAARLRVARARPDLASKSKTAHCVVEFPAQGGPGVALAPSGSLRPSGQPAAVRPLRLAKGGWERGEPRASAATRFLGNAAVLLEFLAPPLVTPGAAEPPSRLVFDAFPDAFRRTMQVLIGDRSRGIFGQARFDAVALRCEARMAAAGLLLTATLERPVRVMKRDKDDVLLRVAALERSLLLDPSTGAILADRGSCTFDRIDVTVALIVEVSDGSGTVSYELGPAVPSVAALRSEPPATRPLSSRLEPGYADLAAGAGDLD